VVHSDIGNCRTAEIGKTLLYRRSKLSRSRDCLIWARSPFAKIDLSESVPLTVRRRPYTRTAGGHASTAAKSAETASAGDSVRGTRIHWDVRGTRIHLA
jgi:hypothetical protein